MTTPTTLPASGLTKEIETMTHTPGAWEISRLATPSYAPEFAIYAESDGHSLARTLNDNSEANAHLIAAAPELLEACKAIAKLNEGQGQLNMAQIAGWARQVVAKAEGRE